MYVAMHVHVKCCYLSLSHVCHMSVAGPGDSVVIHNDLDPFIGLVLASRSFTPAERKSKLYSVWTEKKDRDAWEQVGHVTVM